MSIFSLLPRVKGCFYTVIAWDEELDIKTRSLRLSGVNAGGVITSSLLTGGRIELQLNIMELSSSNSTSFTEAQLKSFEILEKKAEIGRKDVDSFIKTFANIGSYE
jgi:hypothetical protein